MSYEKEVRSLITLSDRHYSILQTILERTEAMSVELDSLRQEVSENTTVTASAVTLIQGLRDKLNAIVAAGTDPAEVAALAAELDRNTNSLAGSLVESTRIDPIEPAPSAPVEPMPVADPVVDVVAPPEIPPEIQ